MKKERLKYDWKKLPVVMKRFPLSQKLAWCSKYAFEVCPNWYYDAQKLKSIPHPMPWELNVVAMLSILGEEYDNKLLDQRKFFAIVNAIRTAILFHDGDDFESVMHHCVVGSQMFYQTEVRVFLSRYYYIFTHQSVSLDKIVEEELGVPYRNLLGLAMFVWSCGVNGEPFMPVLDGLVHNKNVRIEDSFRKAVSALSLTRQEFIRRQNKKIDLSPRGYLLADNILEQYPFLRIEDSVTLPLSYLVKNAVTVGLLHRIATGDRIELRNEIGKRVIEDYVCKIMKFSGAYDQVFPERPYERNAKRSPDVIAFKDEECVLIEVKFKEPILKLRSLQPEDERGLDVACAKAIEQLYRGIKEREKYLKEKQFDESHIYGLVVLFEEPRLSRYRIFECLKELHPDWTDEILAYLKAHVRVVSLYDLEVICFRHHGVFNVLNYYKDNQDHVYDMSFFLLDKPEDVKLDIPDFDDMIEHAIPGFSEMISDVRNEADVINMRQRQHSTYYP